MKFLLRHNAYINVPTHLPNDPPELIRQLPTLIKAEPSAPTVLELADDVSLDNISSSWEPLDDAAKAALGRLAELRAQIRAAAPVRKDGEPVAAVPAKAPEVGTVLDQLKALPEAERAKILAAIAADEAKAKADAATAGTMSGAIAKQGAAQKHKA